MKIGKFKIMNNIFPVITIYSSSIGEDIIILSNKNLLFSFKILKTHINYQYKILSCLTGVDYTNNTYRFGIVYDILSTLHNARLRIKVFINDSSFVYSIVSLFINSD